MKDDIQEWVWLSDGNKFTIKEAWHKAKRLGVMGLVMKDDSYDAC